MQLKTTISVIVLAVACGLPTGVAAQTLVPATGSTGIGGEVGLFFPADERLQTALSLDGLYEYYLSPRVGMRAMFGWSDPGFDRLDRSLRQIRLTIGLNYNWEGGKWHPFVGAGVGAYFLQEQRADRSDPDSETKGGFHLAGGFEYFAQRDVTIKGELRYHVVSDDERGTDPSGVALTVGLKRYF